MFWTNHCSPFLMIGPKPECEPAELGGIIVAISISLLPQPKFGSPSGVGRRWLTGMKLSAYFFDLPTGLLSPHSSSPIILTRTSGALYRVDLVLGIQPF